MQQTISSTQNDIIETLLGTLLVKAEADAIFLCDRAGNIMAQHCSQAYSSEDNIAALASGSFFATRALAELVGESEFRSVIHMGARTSLYMQYMNADLLLLVLFSKDSNPGLVKLYTNECCRDIDSYFKTGRMAADAVAANSVVFEMDSSKQPFARVGKGAS